MELQEADALVPVQAEQHARGPDGKRLELAGDQDLPLAGVDGFELEVARLVDAALLRLFREDRRFGYLRGWDLEALHDPAGCADQLIVGTIEPGAALLRDPEPLILDEIGSAIETPAEEDVLRLDTCRVPLDTLAFRATDVDPEPIGERPQLLDLGLVHVHFHRSLPRIPLPTAHDSVSNVNGRPTSRRTSSGSDRTDRP